jgi:PIN domain nuclease of toxin-antitoxin system
LRLLLDTHVCLWALAEPNRLSHGTARAIADPDNDVRISAATAWEIAIKQSLGKLELPGPAEEWLPAALAQSGLEWIDVTPTDALSVQALPWHHRDPFDRLLIAQALRGFTLVTHDPTFARYGVALLRP